MKKITLQALVLLILSNYVSPSFALNQDEIDDIRDYFVEASELLAESDGYNAHCPAPENYYVKLEDMFFDLEEKHKQLLDEATENLMDDADTKGEDAGEAYWQANPNCKAIYNHQMEQLDDLDYALHAIETTAANDLYKN
jgi:hypothetical protein